MLQVTKILLNYVVRDQHRVLTSDKTIASCTLRILHRNEFSVTSVIRKIMSELIKIIVHMVTKMITY